MRTTLGLLILGEHCMGELKAHQPPMTIDEQVENLNSKAPFVRNFRENCKGGNLPIYALVEVFSFGTLSKFYKNMHNYVCG